MDAPKVTVQLGERSYPIYIQANLLEQLGSASLWTSYSHTLLVSNETVFPLYGAVLEAALQQANVSYTVHIVSDGEAYKSWESMRDILDVAVEIGLDRKSAVMALGGGVIGDLASFVAAVYMRGIDVIQIPTTLLSAVDSSVGGKVAVNHPKAKNILGFFHQPSAVFMDLNVLQTLPARECAAGMAEVIKYGVIYDADFFGYLEDHVQALQAKQADVLSYVIQRCCEIKVAVVEQDEKEAGMRAILNFGHTFGHALEAVSDYKHYVHGESVAIGMVYAGQLALNLDLWRQDEQDRLVALIEAYGLPTGQDQWTLDQLMPALLKDKKFIAGRMTFVLPTRLGQVELNHNLTSEDLREVVS